AVDEVEAKPAAVAEEVAVHLAIVTVEDTARCAIAFVGHCVAAEGAMHADRWCPTQIPFALVNLRERLVVEHAGWADFREIAAELAFKNAVLVATEVDVVVRGEDIEIAASGILAIEADAAVAGDAAIHLMSDERPQILVAEGALLEAIAAIDVPRH